MIVFLDTGVIGLISSPKNTGEAQYAKEWLFRLLSRSIYVVSSDICDYEVRRGLLLASMKNPNLLNINNLDELQEIIDFIPITKEIMKQAAWLWALSQTQGNPTANPKNIDADLIISATCQGLQSQFPVQSLVAATTNVKHLNRFIDAQQWREIKF